jgi:predicted nucleic acid-binding protein
MLWIYWDASALVKRYSDEPGSLMVNEAFQLINPMQMICSHLGILEIISVLVRKRNDGRLLRPFFDEAMAAFKTEITNNPDVNMIDTRDHDIFAAVPLIESYNLNATDAIVLQTSRRLGSRLQGRGQHLSLWTSFHSILRSIPRMI